MSRLLKPVDVADRMQVSVRTVQYLIAKGELPAVRLGPKLYRIRPEDYERYEANLCPTTNSSDQQSTADKAKLGTSSGAKEGAAVVSLRRRLTR